MIKVDGNTSEFDLLMDCEQKYCERKYCEQIYCEQKYNFNISAFVGFSIRIVY